MTLTPCAPRCPLGHRLLAAWLVAGLLCPPALADTLKVQQPQDSPALLDQLRRAGLEEAGGSPAAQLLTEGHVDIVPVVTPWVRQGEQFVVDRASVEQRYFPYLWNAQEVRAVLLAGATAESFEMSPALRRQVIEVTTPAAIRQGFTTFVQITGGDLPETLALARRAVALGAHALVFAPMRLVMQDREVIEVVNAVSAIARAAGVPLVLYNNPAYHRSQESVSPGVVEQLWLAGTIAGIKDSSGRPEVTAAYQGTRIPTFQGNEQAIGEDGRAVASLGNIWRGVQVAAVTTDRRDRAALLQATRRYHAVLAERGQPPAHPARLKYILAQRGLMEAVVLPQVSPVTSAQAAAIARAQAILDRVDRQWGWSAGLEEPETHAAWPPAYYSDFLEALVREFAPRLEAAAAGKLEWRGAFEPGRRPEEHLVGGVGDEWLIHVHIEEAGGAFGYRLLPGAVNLRIRLIEGALVLDRPTMEPSGYGAFIAMEGLISDQGIHWVIEQVTRLVAPHAAVLQQTMAKRTPRYVLGMAVTPGEERLSTILDKRIMPDDQDVAIVRGVTYRRADRLSGSEGISAGLEESEAGASPAEGLSPDMRDFLREFSDIPPGVFHPNHWGTALMLEAMERVAPAFQRARVLDMGTGSGILGLAALQRFGAQHVVATDINPDAPTAVKTHAYQLGVTDERLDVRLGSLLEPVRDGEQFDVALLSAPNFAIAMTYAEQVGRVLTPDGMALLMWHGGEMDYGSAAVREAGMTMRPILRGDDGWRVYVLARRPLEIPVPAAGLEEDEEARELALIDEEARLIEVASHDVNNVIRRLGANGSRQTAGAVLGHAMGGALRAGPALRAANQYDGEMYVLPDETMVDGRSIVSWGAWRGPTGTLFFASSALRTAEPAVIESMIAGDPSPLQAWAVTRQAAQEIATRAPEPAPSTERPAPPVAAPPATQVSTPPHRAVTVPQRPVVLEAPPPAQPSSVPVSQPAPPPAPEAIAEAIRTQAARNRAGRFGPNQQVSAILGSGRSQRVRLGGDRSDSTDRGLGLIDIPGAVLPATIPVPALRRWVAEEVDGGRVLRAMEQRTPGLAAILDEPLNVPSSDSPEARQQLQDLLAATRRILEYDGAPEAEARLQAEAQHDPQVADAITAFLELDQRQFETLRQQARVRRGLEPVMDADGYVPAATLRNALTRYAATFEDWPAGRGATAAYRDRLPAKGPVAFASVEAFLDTLREAQWAIHVLALVARHPIWPTLQPRVYFDLFRTARWRQVTALQARLAARGPSATPFDELVWETRFTDAHVSTLLNEAAFAEAVQRVVRHADPEQTVTNFPIGGVGILFLGRDGRPRRFVPGGGGRVVAPSLTARYSPVALQEWVQPGDRVVLCYPSLTGPPNLEQVEGFLRDAFLIRWVLDGGPEAWLGVTTPTGEVRVYRPRPALEALAAHPALVEALAVFARWKTTVWEGLLSDQPGSAEQKIAWLLRITGSSPSGQLHVFDEMARSVAQVYGESGDTVLEAIARGLAHHASALGRRRQALATLGAKNPQRIEAASRLAESLTNAIVDAVRNVGEVMAAPTFREAFTEVPIGGLTGSAEPTRPAEDPETPAIREPAPPTADPAMIERARQELIHQATGAPYHLHFLTADAALDPAWVAEQLAANGRVRPVDARKRFEATVKRRAAAAGEIKRVNTEEALGGFAAVLQEFPDLQGQIEARRAKLAEAERQAQEQIAQAAVAAAAAERQRRDAELQAQRAALQARWGRLQQAGTRLEAVMGQRVTIEQGRVTVLSARFREAMARRIAGEQERLARFTARLEMVEVQLEARRAEIQAAEAARQEAARRLTLASEALQGFVRDLQAALTEMVTQRPRDLLGRGHEALSDAAPSGSSVAEPSSGRPKVLKSQQRLRAKAQRPQRHGGVEIADEVQELLRTPPDNERETRELERAQLRARAVEIVMPLQEEDRSLTEQVAQLAAERFTAEQWQAVAAGVTEAVTAQLQQRGVGVNEVLHHLQEALVVQDPSTASPHEVVDWVREALATPPAAGLEETAEAIRAARELLEGV